MELWSNRICDFTTSGDSRYWAAREPAKIRMCRFRTPAAPADLPDYVEFMFGYSNIFILEKQTRTPEVYK